MAVLVAAVSYSTMGGLMAATPVAMADVGHSFADSTLAIELHVLGMFVPSLFSGDLVRRLGVFPMMVAGLLILGGGAAVYYAGEEVWHFSLAIALVGIGWNFAFVASTGLYSKLVRPHEQPVAQRFNEIIVLGSLSIFLVSSSYMLEELGFDGFVLFHIVFSAVGVVIALVGWKMGFEPVQKPAEHIAKPTSATLRRQSSVV